MTESYLTRLERTPLDRRQFLNVGMAAAVATGALSSVAPRAAAQSSRGRSKISRTNDKTGHYRVDHEYARMREVVLGGTALMCPPKGTYFDKYIEELYPDEETRASSRTHVRARSAPLR